MLKSYRELIRLPTFEERFDYLRLGGVVGRETYGFERYINQTFYKTKEWRKVRNDIIVRDKGWDLAVPHLEIIGRIIVHHINPITAEDIELGRDCIFDPNNLVCTAHDTSNAIHYGDASLLAKPIVERRRGDTCPWR